MCGIAGFALEGGTDAPGASAALTAALANRGPDGSGSSRHAGYELVHTRLAIIDLSPAVEYPMPSEDGSVRLLFNGEIYDYPLLRAELERLGHTFRTRCDAEVVVHGYEEWGEGVFARLNGMYALAIADARSGRLLLARDPLGIKPLVYTTGGRFGFGSDAIALVRAGLSSGELDMQALDGFLALHFVLPPATGLADVRQVEPGSVLVREPDGRLESRRFVAQPLGPSVPRDFVPLEEFEHALSESVRRQLVADVEVGILLSSGIDSSLVLWYAAQHGARPHAFTLSFPGHGDYDEVAAARELAERMGVRHTVGELSVGFADAIGSVGAAFDQPFADSSAVATLELARLAADHVTVVLSGTGGDDLFAGYYRHRAHTVQRLVGALPAAARDRLAGLQVARGSERDSMGTLARSYVARLAQGAGGGPQRQYARTLASHGGGLPEGLVGVPREPEAVVERLAGLAHGSTILRGIQTAELATYLPGDLLTKEDRATMAVGLEGRVPLLDAAMVDLADRAPDRQKATLLQGKVPLRKLARRRLPARHWRRKRGFAVPLQDLLAGPWARECRDWLDGRSSALVDTAQLARNVGGTAVSPADVWALCALVAWEERVTAAREPEAREARL